MTDYKWLKLHGIEIGQDTASFSYPWTAYKEGKRITSGFPSKRTLLEHLKNIIKPLPEA